MKNQKKKSFPRRVFLCLLAVLLAVCIAFGVYVSDYYHADPAAEDALVSDDVVSVTKQNGNWVFAPESPIAGLIFYPGGKVENTAYAPPPARPCRGRHSVRAGKDALRSGRTG